MNLVAKAILKHDEERLICIFESLRSSFEKTNQGKHSFQYRTVVIRVQI